MRARFRPTIRALFVSMLFVLAGCGADEPGPAGPSEAAPPAAPSAERDVPPPDESPPPPRDVEVKITPERDPGLETVRRYTRMFYDGELEQLFEAFSPEMRNEVLPLDKLRELREFVRREYGEELEVIGEDSQTRDDYRGFVRWARFSDHEGLIEIQWILRPDDAVAGLLVRPARRPESG